MEGNATSSCPCHSTTPFLQRASHMIQCAATRLLVSSGIVPLTRSAYALMPPGSAPGSEQFERILEPIGTPTPHADRADASTNDTPLADSGRASAAAHNHARPAGAAHHATAARNALRRKMNGKWSPATDAPTNDTAHQAAAAARDALCRKMNGEWSPATDAPTNDTARQAAAARDALCRKMNGVWSPATDEPTNGMHARSSGAPDPAIALFDALAVDDSSAERPATAARAVAVVVRELSPRLTPKTMQAVLESVARRHPAPEDTSCNESSNASACIALASTPASAPAGARCDRSPVPERARSAVPQTWAARLSCEEAAGAVDETDERGAASTSDAPRNANAGAAPIADAARETAEHATDARSPIIIQPPSVQHVARTFQEEAAAGSAASSSLSACTARRFDWFFDAATALINACIAESKPATRPVVRGFLGTPPAGTTIHSYLTCLFDLAKRIEHESTADVHEAILVGTLIYFWRTSRKIRVTGESYARLLLACFRAAFDFMTDPGLRTCDFARCVGLKTQDINWLQAALLRVLDFRLFLGEDDVHALQAELARVYY